MSKKRKLVLVGTGFVGMSMAYSFLSTGGLDEMVLIDVVAAKAEGEAMDLNHGLPYARGKMTIKAGGYEECGDAAVVVVTAGVAQKPGETRLELTARNAKIMKNVVEQIRDSGFNGVLVVASNPVDSMTYEAWKVSGLPRERVIGSGTLLDTARLRYLMGEKLQVSTSNVHAYVMGEHGDSSFVPWTQANIGCKNLLELLDENGEPLDELQKIHESVVNAAYEIIEKKRATYYGIGLSLNRLVHCILDNENAVLTVSAYQNGEYEQEGLYIGVPAIVNREGVREIVKLPLNEMYQERFNKSCETLKKVNSEIVDPIIAE